MTLLLPLKQPEPINKFITKTFYSQCKKKDAPKNAEKTKKTDYNRYRDNWKDLGENKGCSYWKWDETIENKYDLARLEIGRGNCFEDYLIIKYNENGDAIKIEYTRCSMFRENYDIYEVLKSVVLKDSTYKTLLEITRLFDIDLNKYKYPMTNIKWNNIYKIE